MKKNIIVLMDGTWDNLLNSKTETNVAKLKNLLFNNSSQLVYYDDGVGSDSSGIGKYIDAITGLGINNKIIDGYQFIAENYNQGDDVYLFGFSRGAYTVRFIADFISHMGLLKKLDNLDFKQKITDFYNSYLEVRSSTVINNNIANICKIKMLGVWDTVGELGIPLNFLKNTNYKLFEFHDTILHENVLFGYQAIAIDEKRKDFMPCLWSERVNIEQVWFAGSHSYIGGGYEESDLSDITLNWMVNKAMMQGIIANLEVITSLKPNPLGEIHDPTLTFPFNLLEKQLRVINENSKFNKSVQIRLKNKNLNYQPQNLPKNIVWVI